MKKKKIILFSITALMICLVAVLSCVFINSNNNELENSNLILDFQNSEKIKLKATRKYSNNNEFPSIVVNASINDDYSGSDYLDWNLLFDSESWGDQDGGQEWLRLVVSEDKLSATIVQKDNFPCQFILKVSSHINPNVYATMTIDCVEKTTDVTGYIMTGGGVSSNNNILDLSNYDFNSLMTILNFDDLNNVKSAGSLNSETNVTCRFKLSNRFRNFLSDTELESNSDSILFEPEDSIIYTSLCHLIGVTELDNHYLKACILDTGIFGDYFDDNTYVHVADFEFVYSDHYEGDVVSSYSYSIELYINLSFNSTSISTVSLDRDNIIF